MLTHAQIWSAIDRLAERHRLTASGLARRAGLDATTFNPSKRITSDGHQRWPSTESIAKIIEATSTSLDEFMALLHDADLIPRPRAVPLIGLAQAGAGGFFDDGGHPVGSGWDEVPFPGVSNREGVYAVEITGDSMLPLYREGDIVIVSPLEPVRRGDRVVVKTTAGEVMAKTLQRRTLNNIELTSFNPDYPPRSLSTNEVEWIARIVWASQ